MTRTPPVLHRNATETPPKRHQNATENTTRTAVTPEPRRKMGRPIIYPGDPMHSVTVWIPRSFYAKAVSIARQRDVSVQRVLRMTLMRHLPNN